jgi:putative ABC transport system permease protein
MFKLALKGAWARKLRLSLLVLIIMSSVAFIVGTFVFTDTIKSGFGDVFGTVYKDTSAVVRGQKIAKDSDDFDSGARNLVPASVVDKIRTDPNVTAAEGTVQIFLNALDKKGKVLEIGPPTFGYIWSDTPGTNPFRIVEGTTPKEAGDVVINKTLATIGKFVVGDTIDVVAGDKPEKFKIVGLAKFGTTDGNTLALLFSKATALRLSGFPGEQYNEIFIVGKPGISQSEVRNSVEKTLNDPKFETITGAKITEESQKVFQDFIGGITKFLLGFGMLALLVGIFVIYNTFSILIAQRQREVALLRAIGASGKQIRRSVVIEALLLGAVGSGLGIGFGMLLAFGLKALFAAFGAGGLPGTLSVQPRTVIVGALAGMIATLASAYLPARRASKISPMAAMQGAALDGSGSSKIRTLLGIGLLPFGFGLLGVGLKAKNNGIVFAGLAFLVVIIAIAVLGPVLVRPIIKVLGAPLPKLRGMAGLLARENAVRNPRRTASSALALTIGVAVIAFFLVVGQSIKKSVAKLIDKQFTADYIVSSSAQPGGLAKDVVVNITSVQGVGASSSFRFAIAAIDGKKKPIIGTNPASAAALFDFGKVSGAISDLVGDTIAVKESVATKNGWTVGSTVKTVLESGPVDLKVAAIFEKNDALNADYLMGLDSLTARTPSITKDAFVAIKLAPGADATAVRAALDKQIESYPTLRVSDRAEFKKRQSSQINGLLIFITILLVLAILIALIGIAITLALSIFERVRELGVLRAIGQQRSQTRVTVRWEAVLISVLGTVLGLVIGTIFGVAIVKAANDAAFSVVAVPIGSLIAIGVLGALGGVAASLWPAYKASKTDIMQALATA